MRTHATQRNSHNQPPTNALAGAHVNATLATRRAKPYMAPINLRCTQPIGVDAKKPVQQRAARARLCACVCDKADRATKRH